MRFSPSLSIIACALVLGLSGCVAVPLAQLAVSQMASSKPACPGCTTEAATGTFGDISKGFGDSFHKLTGGTPADQQVLADMPAK